MHFRTLMYVVACMRICAISVPPARHWSGCSTSLFKKRKAAVQETLTPLSPAVWLAAAVARLAKSLDFKITDNADGFLGAT